MVVVVVGRGEHRALGLCDKKVGVHVVVPASGEGILAAVYVGLFSRAPTSKFNSRS